LREVIPQPADEELHVFPDAEGGRRGEVLLRPPFHLPRKVVACELCEKLPMKKEILRERER
jgi:hypothetical protein